MSISEVRRYQGITAGHNVVDCLRVCTAKKTTAEHCTHNTESEELGLEQQQPVFWLQQKYLMTSAIHMSTGDFSVRRQC